MGAFLVRLGSRRFGWKVNLGFSRSNCCWSRLGCLNKGLGRIGILGWEIMKLKVRKRRLGKSEEKTAEKFVKNQSNFLN